MSVAMEEWPREHRITVDEYHRMARAGLLAPEAHVELIEGEIIDMPPIGPRHAAAVDRLNRILHRSVGDRAIVRCQQPIRLGTLSEPQPDLALLSPREDFYGRAHPTAGDTLLIVEVSHATLRYDWQVKMPLYARHGVQEVWIVDTEGGQLHLFRRPAEGVYIEVQSLQGPANMAITLLPAVVVDLSPIIG